MQRNRHGRIDDTNKAAIHFYVVPRGRLDAEIGAALAVDCDATGRNQFVTMTARTDTGSGQETIETHGVAVKNVKAMKR